MRRLRTLTIDDPLAPLPAGPTPAGADGHAPDRRLRQAGGSAPASAGLDAGGSRARQDDTRSAAPADRPTSGVYPRGDLFAELGTGGRLRVVPIDAITPNPQQPRSRFDEEAIQALADSIADRGVLQPPIVRRIDDGAYEIVAGERRWRAARLAGLTELAVLVTVADDRNALQDAVMENVLREDLSPVEEARAYAMLTEDLGITREALGRRVGRSRVSISNHMRLLDLSDDVLELLDTGRLSFAHGRALLLCDDHATRRELARDAVTHGWSTRQLEDAARRAGAPRAQRSASQSRAGAEQESLAQQISDAVSQATGAEVLVRATARDGYTFTIHGHATALAIAAKLGADRLPEL
jgi:ParB family transcriptional regulator, chromosome partitioning protein